MSLLKGTPYSRVYRGMGYSPASGPPIGSRAAAMSTFFNYNTLDLLPNSALNKPNKWFYGSAKRRRRRLSFGNPRVAMKSKLSGLPSPGVPNMRVFPNLGAYPGEVGPGTTPGGTGTGGSLYPGPGNPMLNYYLMFGRKSRRRRRRRSGKKRKRRSKRRRRKRRYSKR